LLYEELPDIIHVNDAEDLFRSLLAGAPPPRGMIASDLERSTSGDYGDARIIAFGSRLRRDQRPDRA
jgi:hypothetical protein